MRQAGQESPILSCPMDLRFWKKISVNESVAIGHVSVGLGFLLCGY